MRNVLREYIGYSPPRPVVSIVRENATKHLRYIAERGSLREEELCRVLGSSENGCSVTVVLVARYARRNQPGSAPLPRHFSHIADDLSKVAKLFCTSTSPLLAPSSLSYI